MKAPPKYQKYHIKRHFFTQKYPNQETKVLRGGFIEIKDNFTDRHDNRYSEISNGNRPYESPENNILPDSEPGNDWDHFPFGHSLQYEPAAPIPLDDTKHEATVFDRGASNKSHSDPFVPNICPPKTQAPPFLPHIQLQISSTPRFMISYLPLSLSNGSCIKLGTQNLLQDKMELNKA